MINFSVSQPITFKWWNNLGDRVLTISSIYIHKDKIELYSDEIACKKQKYLQKNSLNNA